MKTLISLIIRLWFQFYSGLPPEFYTVWEAYPWRLGELYSTSSSSSSSSSSASASWRRRKQALRGLCIREIAGLLQRTAIDRRRVAIRRATDWALFSAHSCSCCTQPSCSRSSRVPDLSDTRMSTTRRWTSVLQPHPHQCQLSASFAALNVLTPGWEVTGWEWTPTRHSWCDSELDSSLSSWPPLSSHCFLPLSSFRPQWSTLASRSTVSKPWPTMSPRYAGRAYSNYASFGWSDLHWLWRSRRRWYSRYTRSSAALTVTVCCMGSVTVCWQNSRLSGTRKFDHITPVLHRLHWLPVRQRITFKLAMITFKCRRGLATSYLADVCIPVSSVVGRWKLRSADSGTLVVPGLWSVGETLPGHV